MALAGSLAACDGSRDERVLWRFVAFQRQIWHGYCSSTQPALDGDRLYVGNGYAWSDATHLFALDQRTGRELWRARTGGIFGADPVVDGPVVAIGAGARLMAFSKVDGLPIWSRAGVTSRSTVADGTVYVDVGQGLLALDFASGREIWRVSTKAPLEAPPVVVGGRVYFGVGKPPATLLYVVDRDRGAYVGDGRALPGFNGRLAAADGRVFAEAGLNGRRVTYEWSGDEVAPRLREEGFLTIRDHVAYFVDERGTVRAVDTAGGKDLWTRAGFPLIRRGGSVIDGDVFYQTDLQALDRLRAYDFVSGVELWNFEGGDWIAPIAVGKEAVFVSGDDCTVLALRKDAASKTPGPSRTSNTSRIAAPPARPGTR